MEIAPPPLPFHRWYIQLDPQSTDSNDQNSQQHNLSLLENPPNFV